VCDIVCGGNYVSNAGERVEGEVYHGGYVWCISGATISCRYHGDGFVQVMGC